MGCVLCKAFSLLILFCTTFTHHNIPGTFKHFTSACVSSLLKNNITSPELQTYLTLIQNCLSNNYECTANSSVQQHMTGTPLSFSPTGLIASFIEMTAVCMQATKATHQVMYLSYRPTALESWKVKIKIMFENLCILPAALPRASLSSPSLVVRCHSVFRLSAHSASW